MKCWPVPIANTSDSAATSSTLETTRAAASRVSRGLYRPACQKTRTSSRIRKASQSCSWSQRSPQSIGFGSKISARSASASVEADRRARRCRSSPARRCWRAGASTSAAASARGRTAAIARTSSTGVETERLVGLRLSRHRAIVPRVTVEITASAQCVERVVARPRGAATRRRPRAQFVCRRRRRRPRAASASAPGSPRGASSGSGSPPRSGENAAFVETTGRAQAAASNTALSSVAPAPRLVRADDDVGGGEEARAAERAERRRRGQRAREDGRRSSAQCRELRAMRHARPASATARGSRARRRARRRPRATSLRAGCRAPSSGQCGRTASRRSGPPCGAGGGASNSSTSIACPMPRTFGDCEREARAVDAEHDGRRATSRCAAHGSRASACTRGAAARAARARAATRAAGTAGPCARARRRRAAATTRQHARTQATRPTRLAASNSAHVDAGRNVVPSHVTRHDRELVGRAPRARARDRGLRERGMLRIERLRDEDELHQRAPARASSTSAR